MGKCIECGAEFQGRSDKKFCSSACRTYFNNKIRTPKKECHKRINAILRNNYRIMEHLYNNSRLRVTFSELEVLGFDKRFFTSAKTDSKGETIRHFCCYDFVYRKTRAGTVIIKRGEYEGSSSISLKKKQEGD